MPLFFVTFSIETRLRTMKISLFILLFFITSCGSTRNNLNNKDSQKKDYKGKTILDIFKTQRLIVIIFTDGTAVEFETENNIIKIK